MNETETTLHRAATDAIKDDVLLRERAYHRTIALGTLMEASQCVLRDQGAERQYTKKEIEALAPTVYNLDPEVYKSEMPETIELLDSNLRAQEQDVSSNLYLNRQDKRSFAKRKSYDRWINYSALIGSSSERATENLTIIDLATSAVDLTSQTDAYERVVEEVISEANSTYEKESTRQRPKSLLRRIGNSLLKKGDEEAIDPNGPNLRALDSLRKGEFITDVETIKATAENAIKDTVLILLTESHTITSAVLAEIIEKNEPGVVTKREKTLAMDRMRNFLDSVQSDDLSDDEKHALTLEHATEMVNTTQTLLERISHRIPSGESAQQAIDFHMHALTIFEQYQQRAIMPGTQEADDHITTEDTSTEHNQIDYDQIRRDAQINDIGYIDNAIANQEHEIAQLHNDHIKTKELKAANLSQLCRYLTLGWQYDKESYQLMGVPKQQARETAATMLLLKRYIDSSENLEEASELLGKTLALEMELTDGYAGLQEHRRMLAGMSGASPADTKATPKLNQYVASIAENIDELDVLVRMNLPRQQVMLDLGTVKKLLTEAGYIEAGLEEPITPVAEDEMLEETVIDITDEPEQTDQQEEVEDEASTIFSLQPEIAEQLNWIVLPPNPSREELIEEIQRSYDQSELASLDWQRLEDIRYITDELGGVLYRSAQGSLGSRPPFFVGQIEFDGITLAIAENPLEGHATYIVREDLTPGTWQEVLSLTKKDARAVGATRVRHSSRNGHRQRILDKLQDQLLVNS